MNMQIAELGAPLGLTVTRAKGKSPLFSLAGTCDGISLAIYETTRRPPHSGAGYFWTIYEIPLDSKRIPHNLSMLRKPEYLNSELRAEHNDIQLNNELDKVFKIQGTSSKDVHDFFERPELKKCFLELAARCSSLRLENNTLYFESHQRIIDEGPDFQDRIAMLTRCAHAINNSSSIEATEMPSIEDTEIRW